MNFYRATILMVSGSPKNKTPAIGRGFVRYIALRFHRIALHRGYARLQYSLQIMGNHRNLVLNHALRHT